MKGTVIRISNAFIVIRRHWTIKSENHDRSDQYGSEFKYTGGFSDECVRRCLRPHLNEARIGDEVEWEPVTKQEEADHWAKMDAENMTLVAAGHGPTFGSYDPDDRNDWKREAGYSDYY